MESSRGTDKYKRRYKCFLKQRYVFILLLLIHNYLYAAGWSFSPGIEMAESYDDNINLARDGNERNDYITELNPGFVLIGEGARSKLSLSYRMQNIFYQYHSGNDSTFHNVNAATKTEIIRNKLFFDASVSQNQRNLNNENPSGYDNTSINDNRTNVRSYTVKPYLIHNFGQSAILRMEHTYQEVDNESDELLDANVTTNTSRINLSSGPAFTDFRWQVMHQEQVTDYSRSPDVENRSTNISSRYYYSNKFYQIVNVGYEKYNYRVDEGQKKPEGEYWEVGFGWMPSQRTLVEATGGEHYYGNTKGFTFTHRTRQSNWRMGYAENISTTSRVDSDIDTVLIFNEETNEFDEYITESNYNRASVSHNKVTDVAVTKTTAKTSFTLAGRKIRSKYLDIPGEQDNLIVRLEWEWRFTSNTSISLESNYNKSSFSISENETTFKRHGVKFTHFHTRNTTSYVGYTYSTQASDETGVQYRRNIYKAGIEFRF